MLEELQDSAGARGGGVGEHVYLRLTGSAPSAGSTVISADLRDAEYQEE